FLTRHTTIALIGPLPPAADHTFLTVLTVVQPVPDTATTRRSSAEIGPTRCLEPTTASASDPFLRGSRPALSVCALQLHRGKAALLRGWTGCCGKSEGSTEGLSGRPTQ